MRKLFRYHRGGLAESLETTIEVTGLADLRHILSVSWPSLRNVRISPREMIDPRLPSGWRQVSYYVIADFDGYEGQCVGMTNFYEP